ncbi:hypothetical protein Trydic_g17541, partial [Trypoxylus dichotomus]
YVNNEVGIICVSYVVNVTPKRKTKWDHIYTAYKIDNAFGELRILTKLTEEHCNPQKMSKKVSIAAQVLSHSTTAARNIFFKIRHYQHMW